VIEWTWRQVCARRLARHGLVEPAPPAGLVDQVGAMCGAHAQVSAAAELSIGLRVEGTTRSTVRSALWEERVLVKTYGPRGTVHLLPAVELPMWAGALAATPWPPRFGPGVQLDDDQVDEVVAAIADALGDAELTVDELGDAVVARVGTWAGARVMPAFQDLWPRWRQVIQQAANRGALCFGPDRGRRVTYTSPRRWLPGFVPADPTTSLAEVVRRYLRAYGPATSAHFAQWLGVPRRAGDVAFADVAEELVPVRVGDVDALVLAEDADPPGDRVPAVRLLPYFDAYVVGSHPRPLVYPGRASERALAGGGAGPYPVLLLDGVVGGVWHQRRAGRRLIVTVEPLHDLTARQRAALDVEVARVGEIVEAGPELVLGPVAVGPHA
jgi:hypothetical protein